jgi:hypothetical protein
MRGGRNYVVVVIPLLALEVAMNQVGSELVVFLLAVAFAGFHGRTSLRIFSQSEKSKQVTGRGIA